MLHYDCCWRQLFVHIRFSHFISLSSFECDIHFQTKKIARLSLNFWQHCGSILHISRYGFLGALLDYFLKHATNSHFCKGHHFTTKYLAGIFSPFYDSVAYVLQKNVNYVIFLIKTVPVDNQIEFFFSWYLLLWSRLFPLKSISVILKKKKVLVLLSRWWDASL